MSNEFKVGDIVYCYDEYGDRGEPGPIIFYGTGKESARLYPRYAKFRRQVDYVVMWDEQNWCEAEYCRKLTALEKALK